MWIPTVPSSQTRRCPQRNLARPELAHRTNPEYAKTLATKHAINLLAGSTTQKFFGDYARVNAQNFPNDAVRNLSAGQIVGGANTEYQNSLILYLGCFNYAYDGKYLSTASIRTK